MDAPERWRNFLSRAKFRFLRRVHRRGRRSLWSLSRIAVARAVAIGCFFGVIMPVAQIAFAIPVAIALRANLWITAMSTLVSNPVTMPFIYIYAYRAGSAVAPWSTGMADDAAMSELASERSLEISNWPEILFEWISQIAMPFMFGLLALASLASAIAYFTVRVAWQGIARSVPDRLRQCPCKDYSTSPPNMRSGSSRDRC
jgi:uncharacterized protein (DUF2062 family)